MNQDGFRKLISCQSGGKSSALLRVLLTVAAQAYSIVLRVRNFLYSKGWLTVHRANAIVISIGNITTGGTGKTPLVIWLYNYINQKSKTCGERSRTIKNQKYACAILTRGYKANNQKRATSDQRRVTRMDEPAIFAENCPQAKVVVNPDRVAGAFEAVSKFGAKVLIMDDGFQHRRLARDLDIVTIDATQPFGYGKVLPAGLLREPIAELSRADAIVITRCDQIEEHKLAELEKKLRQINGNMIITRSVHTPICAKSAENREINLEKLKGKRIFAFCGIGNPQAFLSTIKATGAELVGSKIYDDHYHYTPNDFSEIYDQAEVLKADLILTTQKDWSSTQYAIRNTQYEIPFAYLKIELKFTSGEDKLTALIENTLAGKIPAK